MIFKFIFLSTLISPLLACHLKLDGYNSTSFVADPKKAIKELLLSSGYQKDEIPDIPESTQTQNYQKTLQIKKICQRLWAGRNRAKTTSSIDELIHLEDCHRFRLMQNAQKNGDVRYTRKFDSPDWSKSAEYEVREGHAAFGPALHRRRPLAKKAISPEDAVQISFRCTMVKSVCDKAEAGFKRVATAIGKLIAFNTTIKIRAEYISFCCELKECSGSILGQAAAESYWSLQKSTSLPGTDPFYVYPQALAKQLSLEEKDWTEYDIRIQFNADNGRCTKQDVNRFWFPEDKKPIRSSQIDFGYVAFHEILHGMGLSSGLRPFYGRKGQRNSRAVGVLTPSLRVTRRRSSGESLYSFAPLNIFDKFIRQKGEKEEKEAEKPLSESYFIISDYGLSDPKPYQEFLSTFYSKPALQESLNLYSAATKAGQLVFRAGDEEITLFTARAPFSPGSSLSHVAPVRSKNASDILMAPSALRGIVLGLSKNGVPNLGSATLTILKAIGWTLRSN